MRALCLPTSNSQLLTPNLIREATQSDIEDVVFLWTMLQKEHELLEPRLRMSRSAEQRWRTDYPGWVRSNVHGVFVAEVDERIVGMITVHPYWPAPIYEERKEAYINDIIVHPDYRGRGIARKLVKAVQEWAQERAISRIRAGVIAANPEALAFWKKIGAEPFYVTVTLGV